MTVANCREIDERREGMEPRYRSTKDKLPC
jgi:hypothetical protein